MLDNFIKFLEWVSTKLKKRKEKIEKDKMSGKYKPYILISIFTILIVGVYLYYLIFYGAGFVGILANGNRIFGLLRTAHYLVLGIAILQFILLIPIIGLYKKEGAKHFFLTFLPLYLALFFVSLWILMGTKQFDFDVYYVLKNEYWILNILIGIYPIINIAQFCIKRLKNTWIEKFKKITYLYNLGFFFFLSVNILLISVGVGFDFMQPFGIALIEFLSSNRYIYSLGEGFFFLFIGAILILWPIYTFNLKISEEGVNRKDINIGILIFAGFFILSFGGIWVDKFYDYQIQRAQNIISLEGENFRSYDVAKSIFLDKAFLKIIKKGKSINHDLFNKIFDSTVEQYFGEKVANYIGNSRSFATDVSKIGEKSNVVLSLGEIENVFRKTTETGDIAIMETTYRFHFYNLSEVNQEVVLFFETPSIDSVISELKLGLDLELLGQFSARGAARKVYEDSLRRNIDPALIEKVGLNSYSIRIFPIPSKLDKKTQGRQLIEFKVLSPIQETKNGIVYSPKFSLVNIKFDDDSSFISKVYKQGELIKEDLVKGEDLNNYINTNHYIDSSNLNLENIDIFEKYCVDKYLFDLLEESGINISEEKNITNKTRLFFDNSLSVQRNEVEKKYAKILEAFKNYGGKLNDVELYSYNFDVNKISDVNDIKFWGYSNIDRIVDYVINNNFVNEYIVFVTDDDSFNYSVLENKDRNLEGIMSNKISVIKLGKKIKTYKSDFNNLLAASYGNIYQLDDIEQLDQIIEKIKNNQNKMNFVKCEDQENSKLETDEIQNNVNYLGKIMYRWSKVNQHRDMEEGVWKTDPDRTSGADIDMLEYCKKFYPNTKYVIADKFETTNTWRNSGNIGGPYTSNKQSYLCLEDIPNQEKIEINEIQKIYAGIIGNMLLGNIKNTQDWYNIAEKQSEISNRYGIVNQFNSLIALETSQQQRDLDRYNQYKDKYDTTYTNYGKSENIPSPRSPTAFFDMDVDMDVDMADSVSFDMQFIESRSINNWGTDINWGNNSDINWGNGRMKSKIKYQINSNYGIRGKSNVSFFGVMFLLIYLVEFILWILIIRTYIKMPKNIKNKK